MQQLQLLMGRVAWELGKPVIQAWWRPTPPGRLPRCSSSTGDLYEWYPSVALDIALTTSLHGGGYGRRVLRLAIEHFVAKGHHRFAVDPAVENERAIRSYAAAGFKPVGVLRNGVRRRETSLAQKEASRQGRRHARNGRA